MILKSFVRWLEHVQLSLRKKLAYAIVIRQVVRAPIPQDTIFNLRSYSIVNSPELLALIKEACYGKKDIRAGWIGAGIPYTDNHDFVRIAKWAMQHWARYSGFLNYISRGERAVRILDVGCGTGHATICLASILDGYAVTGIDYDDEAIQFARRFNNMGRNVSYICGDFSNFVFRDQKEYIFALEILEHLPSSRHYEFIDKCLAMLTNQGLLFVTTPNALDEEDSTYGHVGMLNRARAKDFIQHYSNRIMHAGFYDNQQMLSDSTRIMDARFSHDQQIPEADLEKFIIRESLTMFEDTSRNRSHFWFVMR